MQQELNIVDHEPLFAGPGIRPQIRSAHSTGRAGSAVLLAIGVLFSLPRHAGAEGPCIPTAPEAVVTCLAEAFNHRDAKQLDALFTPDFVYVQGEQILDRATQLQSHERMFKSSQVKGIVFSAEGISSQSKENSWLVTVAATKLVVSVEREGKAQEFTVHTNGYRFFVRSSGDRFQIFRWEDPTAP